jgi:SAM-dependent methyltransferase
LPETQAIQACFQPYVLNEAWEEAASVARRDTTKAFLRRRLVGWLPGGGRKTQSSVAWNYERQWAAQPLEAQLSRHGAGVACEWRNTRLLARAIGTKRVHLLHLLRLLHQLRPSSVLEVGAGNGVNLLVVAACFAAEKLVGVELTPGGVEAASRVARLPRLPQELLDFCPLAPQRQSVAGAIEFRQADARRLPFQDGEFELVFTSLALEQMEEIRESALRQIVRVARRWVVMIEPFRDFNNDGLRRRYIQAHDYFSASVADLRSFGLEPVLVSADMPHKLTLKPAFVVARKA